MCTEFHEAGTMALTEEQQTILENENRNIEKEINLGFKCNHLADALKYVFIKITYIERTNKLSSIDFFPNQIFPGYPFILSHNFFHIFISAIEI